MEANDVVDQAIQRDSVGAEVDKPQTVLRQQLTKCAQVSVEAFDRIHEP
ncbi:hypothetical protein [Mesorhizobium carmichaelinearum]|nr:hypothetical protein [Mesorhizobium carmichaelinearum]